MDLPVIHSLAAMSLLLVVFRAVTDLEVPAAGSFAKGHKLRVNPTFFIPGIMVFTVVWFISVLGVFLASIELAAVAKMAAPFLWGATSVGTFLATVSIFIFLIIYVVAQIWPFKP